MKRIYFKEEQQWSPGVRILLLALATGSTVMFVSISYWQIVRHIPVGDHPMENDKLLTLSIIMILASWITCIMFILVRFTITIGDTGVEYRFAPLPYVSKFVNREDILNYTVRKCNPWKEFKGYGINRTPLKRNRSIILGGNNVLELTTNDGKKIFLGTRKPDLLSFAMKKLMDTQKEVLS